MALETVRILIEDDELVPSPVDDVVVRVFDETGTTLITQGTTGAVDPGIAEVTLDGDNPPTAYQLRFFISGGQITGPRLIAVYSPPSLASTGANNFKITASLFTMPQAMDPLLCRASGVIRGPDGRPKQGIDMHFIPLFNPLLVGGAAVLGERVAVRTDRTGYVSIDLFRDGMYEVTVESQENVRREVCVPDRSSVSLPDLLFPVVASVVYDVDPLTLSDGGELTIVPTVTATDFRVLCGTGVDDVIYTSDDPAIASLEVLSDRIVIHGNAPGSTILRAVRRDGTIVRVPDSGIAGGEADITVV